MTGRLLRRSRLVVASGVLGLGLAGLVLPAGQAAGSTSTTVPFKANFDDYAHHATHITAPSPVIGSVTFVRSGSALDISVAVHRTPSTPTPSTYDPGTTTYTMELWYRFSNPYDGAEYAPLGALHVNGSGNGTASFHVDVPKTLTNFFLAARTKWWNESEDVYLPYVPVTIVTTCISHTQTCSTAASKPGRSTTVTSGKVTATAEGRGSLSLGTFRANPVGVPAGVTGKTFGVSLSTDSAFSNVVVRDCDLAGGTTLTWWNGHTWMPVASQGAITRTPGCLTFSIGKTSVPSLSTVVRESRLSRFGAVVFRVAA